jgi:hypothetical protein
MISAANLRGSGWTERREHRTKVLIRATMRAGGPRIGICIRDVSRRGLLVQAPSVPARGTIVEIMLPDYSIAGQVMWAKDRRFGIACEPLNLDRILDPGKRSCSDQPKQDPLKLVAKAAPKPVDTNSTFSRRLQFAAVGLMGAAGAFGAAAMVHHQLSSVAEQIGRSLGDGR